MYGLFDFELPIPLRFIDCTYTITSSLILRVSSFSFAFTLSAAVSATTRRLFTFTPPSAVLMWRDLNEEPEGGRGEVWSHVGERLSREFTIGMKAVSVTPCKRTPSRRERSLRPLFICLLSTIMADGHSLFLHTQSAYTKPFCLSIITICPYYTR